jgi:hypothetical protein
MNPNLKDALAIKSKTVEVVKEYVFGGDFEVPRVEPDQNGIYHYRDKKIHILCTPSGRDGWLNCSVMVNVVRKKWLVTREELVLSTGYGVDVWVFRPGMWIDFINRLADEVETTRRRRPADETKTAGEGAAREDDRFTPIDDSAVFKK